MSDLSLIVRRSIRAVPEKVFAAWTTPEHLHKWWGPPGIECIEADIDLRVGGHYRIGNQAPSGDVLWISGTFERIAVPTELVYTWTVDPGPDAVELVTVRFQSTEQGTDVVVIHERISELSVKESHDAGWLGCLDGLARFLEAAEIS